METLFQDLRYGVRMLIKRPVFTAVAILTIALGIGANTAVFSLVNAILLQPLPFKNSDRLVLVNETYRRETLETRPASYPDYVDIRNQNSVFDEISAYDQPSLVLTGVDTPEVISGEIVSSSYFRVLGVDATIGRTFLAEEDQTPDTHPVAVLSHSLWKRRFGSDPSLVGKTIKLYEKDFTVVGIMPEAFNGIGREAQLWIPMSMVSVIRMQGVLEKRGSRWHGVIARLKPGVSKEQARSELSAIMARLEQAYPDTNKDRGADVLGAQEAIVGDVRPMLLSLLGTVLMVLLIACVNVANLLLARSTVREKEVAIRTALGATRRRLVRQLLTESITLGLLGGVLGLLLSVWCVDLFVSYFGEGLPNFVKIGIDSRVLFFTLMVSLLTGILFGLAPALQTSRQGLNEILKEGGRGSSAGANRNRLRRIFVVSEMALAIVLLVVAGLMIKSFQRLQALDPGFKTEHLLTARVDLPDRYSASQLTTFNQQLIDSVAALPSVESVSLASDIPLGGSSSATLIFLEDDANVNKEIRVYTHRVSPDFFSTIGVPLIRGRAFTLQDNDKSSGKVMISESMARRYWQEQDPTGKRIAVGREKDGRPRWYEIVGVVGDVKYRTLIRDQNRDPDIYFTLLQVPSRTVSMAIRTSGDTNGLISSIQNIVGNLDPNLPIYATASMKELMANQMIQFRFSALLSGIFASLALLLATVGIYGVINYTAAQRTREIGVRIALGAQPSDILALVIKEGMVLVLAGMVFGLIGAFASTRLIAGQLYGVSSTDPVTFVLVPILLSTIALLACYLPARRATKVDPMVALRYE
jgi:putative ABC transport system permease protein